MVPPSHLLKFEWANKHLQALATEIQWWTGAEPYRISEEVDPQGTHTVSVEPFGDPPLNLSLIVGDVVHDFRSGLDHLALGLAEANVGGPVSPEVEERSQFPIYSCRDKFRKGRSWRIGCVHPKAQAVMQRLQPYRRREDWERHPLWVLRELSDFDKHRRLPLVGLQSQLRAFDFEETDTSYEFLQIHSIGGPLEQKTPLISWRGAVGISSGAEVQMNPEVAIRVGFADRAPAIVAHRDVLEVLAEIRDYIRSEVVGNLQPFLQ